MSALRKISDFFGFSGRKEPERLEAHRVEQDANAHVISLAVWQNDQLRKWLVYHTESVQAFESVFVRRVKEGDEPFWCPYIYNKSGQREELGNGAFLKANAPVGGIVIQVYDHNIGIMHEDALEGVLRWYNVHRGKSILRDLEKKSIVKLPQFKSWCVLHVTQKIWSDMPKILSTNIRVGQWLATQYDDLEFLSIWDSLDEKFFQVVEKK